MIRGVIVMADPHDHWPGLPLVLAFRAGEIDRCLRARGRGCDAYTMSARRLILDGAVAERTVTCGRCGFTLTIWPCLHRSPGRDTAAVVTINVCSLCRRDGVKRWAELCDASVTRRGRYLDRQPGRPLGPLLQAEGLVVHQGDEGAWELTREGRRILAEADVAKLRNAAQLWGDDSRRRREDLARIEERVEDVRKRLAEAEATLAALSGEERAA